MGPQLIASLFPSPCAGRRGRREISRAHQIIQPGPSDPGPTIFGRWTRQLRTVGYDGIVCFWDVADLASLRKVSVPAGYVVGSIRHSDGRYALCSDTHAALRVQVVDLDTGESIRQANLPLPWEVTREWGRLAACGTSTGSAVQRSCTPDGYRVTACSRKIGGGSIIKRAN